jgi:hypothetical protein
MSAFGNPNTMKRMSPEQRAYQIRVSRKRNRRRLASKAKRLQRARADVRPPGSADVVSFPDGAIRIAAPRVFTIRDLRARKELLGFIGAIREAAVNKRRSVFVDFRRTTRLEAHGTLLFFAEVDRIRRACPGKRMFHCNYPSNRIVEQVLQHVGILDAFGLKRRLNEKAFDETVKHWRYATHHLVEGVEAAPLMESLDGRLTRALSEGLYVGLTERYDKFDPARV